MSYRLKHSKKYNLGGSMRVENRVTKMEGGLPA